VVNSFFSKLVKNLILNELTRNEIGKIELINLILPDFEEINSSF
jgi:hypothetical protein